MSIKVFRTKSDLSKEVGRYVADVAETCIEKNGRFTVALSGGSLPGLLAKGLLLAYDARDAGKDHFAAWHVFFADERCVELDSEDSNYRACSEAFLSKIPIPEKNVCAIDPRLSDPEKMAADYERRAAVILGEAFSFDLILLGMGPDGHTCSLFPGHPLCRETKKRVAHIVDSPKLPPRRITLTFPTLNAAKRIAFVAAGESKANILPKVFSKGSDLPAARAVAKDGTTTWFLDEAAAKLLGRRSNASY